MSADEEKKGEEKSSKPGLSHKFFLIQSDLNGLVLEVKNGNTIAGTQVYAFRKTEAKEQNWREDPLSLTIRTALNDFCLDIDGGELCIAKYEHGKSTQKWEYGDNAITNPQSGKVLEITGNTSGSKVIMTTPNSQENQSWTYVPMK